MKLKFKLSLRETATTKNVIVKSINARKSNCRIELLSMIRNFFSSFCFVPSFEVKLFHLLISCKLNLNSHDSLNGFICENTCNYLEIAALNELKTIIVFLCFCSRIACDNLIWTSGFDSYIISWPFAWSAAFYLSISLFLSISFGFSSNILDLYIFWR